MKEETLGYDVGSLITLEEFEKRKFVISQIHKGGMGIVFQLIPLEPFTKMVALKTYFNMSDIAQFEREARIWLSIGEHPNIAKPYWYGCWENRQSILSEWYLSSIRGLNFTDWKINDIYFFVSEIIHGLNYAFKSLGIIHQDIKPDNILLDKFNVPKITDFGISFILNENEICIGGTYGYTAPEIYFNEKPSIKSDIFSLGVTIFEILTGWNPFNSVDFFSELRFEKNNFARKIFGAEINNLIEMIDAACQFEMQDRPSSYDELLKILINEPKFPTLKLSKTAEDVAREAMVLAKQGNYLKANDCLFRFLIEHPNNPLILNSLGVNYVRSKDEDKAAEHFKLATNYLKDNDGFYENNLYLDPIANYANCLINNGNFFEANSILELTIAWIQKSNKELYQLYYPEISWHYLFIGQFDTCINLLFSYFRVHSPDNRTMKWLVIAAFLSGQIKELSLPISQLMIEAFPKFDITYALLSIAVSNYLEPPKNRRLFEKAFSDQYDELKHIENEMALCFDVDNFPISNQTIAIILNSIDIEVTGGKFNVNIRQLI
jgi:serine/threonine protein kinase